MDFEDLSIEAESLFQFPLKFYLWCSVLELDSSDVSRIEGNPRIHILFKETLCAVPSPKFCFEQLPYHLHFYHPNFLRLSTFDSSVNFPHVLERPKQRQKKTELIKSRKSKNLQVKNECQK